ncbi:MAG: glycolate oxidase subunit GlcF [Alphaproteobacteria bacterium]|nr:glycolate oxidase subunit GlcF [Rhodospirillales bacterium]MCW9045649.1 glycolate oxidase subunit GlcF [Alphaproteobacteria bacterium]
MQTNFSPEQLADKDIQLADNILRKCVHCGFCTATCPTFVELGDELDSPRGRIYQIKGYLETGKPGDKLVKHLDRCLTCQSCMTTCPSGVDYVHLVDLARERMEGEIKRPFMDRFIRVLLSQILPYPNRFKLAMIGARLGKLAPWALPAVFKGMVEKAPKSLPVPGLSDSQSHYPAAGTQHKRVAVLTGCVQRVLKPSINDATVRLLTRLGCEVVVPQDQGCCGAVSHHMGRGDEARSFIKNNIVSLEKAAGDQGFDAIISNASGCGTTVKDYGHHLKGDPQWAERAEKISGAVRDVSEFIGELGIPEGTLSNLPKVAYHAPCSLQHGLKVVATPKQLLERAGFEVSTPLESHLCCGSAGTYSILQPAISKRLQKRKVDNLERLSGEVIATGNIGCLEHIGSGTKLPIVHTVELLDWALGGTKPDELS